jgi:hypothetical protein
VDRPSISYAQRPDATPQSELSALVAVYRTILESQSKGGRLPDKTGPDDARKDQDAGTCSNCT